MLIEKIYQKKPHVISPDLSIFDAIKKMLEFNVNGFIVVENTDHVVGILSLQDIAAATVPKQFQNNISMAMAMYRKGYFREMVQKLRDKLTKDIMRKEFIKVTLETNIMVIMADFLKNDLYIVPVVKNGNKLLGIVTRSEIRKALAEGIGIENFKEGQKD
jgi:CBS domain-containing protein